MTDTVQNQSIQEIIELAKQSHVIIDENNVKGSFDGYIITASGFVCPLVKKVLLHCYPMSIMDNTLHINTNNDVGLPIVCPTTLEELKDNVSAYNGILDYYVEYGLPQDKAKAAHKIVDFDLF
jgi:hypothetical protein